MRSAKTISALLLAAAVSVVKADEVDRLTYLTFSGPVQLPGVVLEAGTYTFKLAEPDGDRHVVRVFEKSSNRLITTLLTVSNQRLEPAKDPYVMFAERPAGTPQAIKAWFYPGQRIGEEFVYPRRQAEALARANHEPVLSTVSNDTAAVKLRDAEVTRIDERGQEAAAAPANRHAGAHVDVNLPQPGPPSSARTDASRQDAANSELGLRDSGPARRALPQTASEVPLTGLVGAVSLIAACVLSRLQRRSH